MIALRVAGGLFLLAWFACHHQAPPDSTTLAALNAFADVVSPAETVAMASCAEMQRQARAELDAGKPVAGIELRAARSSERCDAVAEVFASIRFAHEQASSMLLAGDMDGADRQLDVLRRLWRSLAETGGE